jgi:hypothetical protein
VGSEREPVSPTEQRSGVGAGRSAAVILAALLLAPHGAAQEPPIVVSPRPPLEPLRLELFDAAFEFEWRQDVDEREPPGGSRQRDVESRFREILELEGGGFAGHPNLLKLDLRGRLWLQQRRLDLESSTGQVESVGEILSDYDVTGTLLQQSPLPLTAYLRQGRNDIDRQFGPSLLNTVTEAGLRLNLRSPRFPSAVEILRRRQEQDDRAGGLGFVIEQATVQGDGQADLGPGQRLWWDFAYDDVEESGTLLTPTSFVRREANLTHTLDFGARQQHQLRSALRLFRESGTSDFRQVRVSERLRFQHADWLATWLDYTFDRLDRDDAQQERQQIEGNVRHQLFESLTTTGRAGAILLDIPTDAFGSDEYFGELFFDYTKRVPLGRFFAGANLRLSRLTESDRGAPIQFLNQAFVFDPAGLIMVDGENIEPGSVVVTDSSGVLVFTEGVDYTILVLPDRVEIMRIAGGNIAPGQSVLVDYTVGPQPGGRTATAGVGFDVRYTFEEGLLRGVSVFGRVLDQEESRTPESPDLPENDFTDRSYGAEYDLWRLFLKAEQRNRDSSISPFDSTRLECRFHQPLGGGGALVLSAIHQEIDRIQEDLRTSTSTFSGRWDGPVTPRLRGSLLLQYQIEDDNRGFEARAFEQQLDLRWAYRQTQIYARVRNTFRNTTADDTVFQTFVVGLRREF